MVLSPNGELCQSFFQFLTAEEANLIQSFINKDHIEVQPIVDILCDHNIFDLPKPSNIMSLVLKASKKALIRDTAFSFQHLIEGLGLFWKKISTEMIDALYQLTVPSSSALIDNIEATKVNAQDQKVTTWLHRYLRSCTKDELVLFVRFVTGSNCYDPNTKIKVEYVNQPPDHLRPASKTCFKILILPRQYASFTRLRENLKFYISNTGNWNVYDFEH